jgi:nicotinate-nucleotide adenylyltransferase
MTGMTRLGVLGGTFDPPHYGHLLLADTARVQLSLDQVFFVPAGNPPHKPTSQPIHVVHRAALVQAALLDACEPAFVLSRIDMDRPGPHYTADTLALVHEEHPGAEVWFLIGADSLNDLPKWYKPNHILLMARLGVLARPGYAPDLEVLAKRLKSAGAGVPRVSLRSQVDWLAGPSLDVSSSALRERVGRGLPLRYLVPPSVAEYVRRHHLYEEESRT